MATRTNTADRRQTQAPPAEAPQAGAMVPVDQREIRFTPLAESEEIVLTIPMIMNTVATPTRGGHRPTVRDCVIFAMLCKARRLNPFVGDAYLVGYDSQDGPTFTLITAIQALRKRAEANPNFDGCRRGIIVKTKGETIEEREGAMLFDGEILLGGWAECFRKDQRIPYRETIKLATYNKNRSLWKTDPEGMIEKCFDEETEVLTTLGFERFSEAQGRAVQVTDSGLEPTDAVPFSKPYSGRMITLDSTHLNFSVTPNHDLLTTAGKVEAGVVFENSRSRAVYWIPRCVRGSRAEFGMADAEIRLAAIYLADGSGKRNRFSVAVSRPAKVAAIESLGLHDERHTRQCAGDRAVAAGRVIVTQSDKEVFTFDRTLISPLTDSGKRVNVASLLALSKRQARIFVDTLVEFDGTVTNGGTRRFYSSNPAILQAFEIAAVAAGYAVSHRRERVTDIATKPNYMVAISDRSEIGVRRWGRDYHNLATTRRGNKHNGLIETVNASGRVWCVTVPTGLIVVRRRGFSMVCGNCGEAASLRRAFPSDLGGLYLREEFEGREDSPPASGSGNGRGASGSTAAKLAELASRSEPGAAPDHRRKMPASP